MNLFKNPKAMYGEIERMRKDEFLRREDRASVSNFFNGAPPLSDEEAADLGFTVNVNHLFGYSDLVEAAGQVMALYNKPTTLFSVELNSAPPGKGALISLKASDEANRVIKKYAPFKSHFQGVSGDAALHGEAVFHFTSRTFPLPTQAPLSKMLVPNGASTDIEELPYFCREGEIGLKEMHRVIRQEPKGWNVPLVKKLLARIYDTENGPDNQTIDTYNVEELEYKRQQNNATWTAPRTDFQVYYFYQRRNDLLGEPVSLTILLKPENRQDLENQNDDGILYSSDRCYDAPRCVIQPLFMDCMIGGEARWHRVMGLGHLNYSLNQAIEMLICRAQQATMEGSMNLWQMKDGATREAVQQILLRHNGVIPEGMQLVPNRFNPNFSGILEMIQFYRQQGSKNAQGITPNNGDSNNQLEIQAAFEQNQAASALNNRAANTYDYLDRMYAEVWARLTNPFITPQDKGYSMVKDFQAAMESAGIPLYWLQPHNVQVTATRIVGDGLRSKEVAAAQFLTQNRQQFSPEVQPKITRLITALSLDNYSLAEELTPIQETPDVPQTLRAESENAVMLTQRQQVKPNADDIDQLHIMQHFPAMQVLLNDGIKYQQSSFTPQQAEAFQVIGAHIVAHIQRIEGRATNSRNDPNKQQAMQFMQQLNQLAQGGQKLLNNLQQQQQGQGQAPVDPVEQAKLQLESQRLQQQQQKLDFAQQKFQVQQGARQQQTAFNQMLSLEKDRREDINDRQNRALNDVQTALQVKQASGNTAPA